MAQIQRILELEFTILEFFPSYVISKIREGEVLGAKEINDLVEVCSDYYEGKDFVYLSYRVNDYNVNPTVYLNLDEVKNLAGIGVIITKPSSLNMAAFERRFSKVPFEIFKDLNDALEWTQKIMTERNKKADL